ncbi:MAG TPA: DUF3102 domain-containing protein [Desulfitobacterium dehalogenans]|uniref:DUF3102 domain-containing protein n=1 Tax=Desulfitobacterium dehalogenans TaxID=36854 RepID=A0A7C7D9Q0_9FIRM|nr:DUF3102 domain-containing protein [Desulfitobacterium dehalogenans]
MNGPIIERTPLVIAAEINMINYQIGKILLTGAIEIGRRLKEAKALLPHGEWGKWLEESVSFSRSTATRLMQIYEEYGPNCASMHNLTYTQAVILLGLPPEEREGFITNYDVENMSTRELRQAITDRDKALEEKKQQALQEKDEIKKDLEDKDSIIARLTTQVQNLERQAEDYKQNYLTEQNKTVTKITEPKEANEEILSVKKTTEPEDDLEAARIKDSVMKYEAMFITHRDNLIKTFEELLKTLTNLARIDKEAKEKNRQAAYELLGNLTNRLEVWPPRVRTNLSVDTSKWE